MTTYARYTVNGTVTHGILDGEVLKEISNSPLEDYSETGNTHSVSEVKLLSPTDPSKVVAIGLNYKSHLGGRPGPKAPEPFLKASTTVIAQDENIVIPKVALDEGVNIQPEAELALVIGKECKGASQSNALDYVFGYTCGNDVSARDWQQNALQWARAKSSDTFGPIGPWMTTDPVSYTHLTLPTIYSV